MRILELQRHAEEHGFDSIKFKYDFLGKSVKCQWLDAYMGIIRIEDFAGIVTVNNLINQLGMNMEYEIIES